MQATERLESPGALLRLDPTTGTLKERKYQVAVVAGPDQGKSVSIDGSVKIGSHPSAELVLQDTTVSRYHVELQGRPEGVRVRDLESTNGTYLQGTRITEVIVEDQATVMVGKTTLRISMVESDLGLPAAQSSFGTVIGASPAMRQLFGILEKVAPTDSTVMLLGETGTGKEVLAHSLHEKSKRKGHPFVVVDCGAVAPTLIESELFGHVKGAFTGAIADRNGAFLEADGGTIFLDELGELPLDLQPKLLRVLEAGTVRRVGEDKQRRVDVRVIAATHRDLEKEIEAGRFRRDLYYRLAVVLVQVPPLRDRLDDIPLLTTHFTKGIGRGEFELPRGLMARFAAYHWPGNVRELRNLVERALAGADVDPLPNESSSARSLQANEGITDLPFKEAKERLVESFTKEYLVALLEKCNGNISQMAREAGIARNYVHRLVTKYGLKAHE
ncbi:MAG: sigma 54-interacting transcriptional regulator [Myxococcaceae bacterium]|nr:sigma 54-interacting transcriptional regulator [Myxococcaceae bacterium]